jgi:hypothetical protein
MNKKTIGLVGMAVLLCSASAFADDTHTSSKGGTMVRSFEAVTGNAVKNPDAPGLQNAQQNMIENAAKHAAHEHGHGAAGAERPQGVDRVEKVEKVERVERVERVEKVERPERPERPERIVRAERPEPPGNAKK